MYIGDDILPSYVGIFSWTIIRIPNKQPVFQWKVSGRVFSSWLKCLKRKETPRGKLKESSRGRSNHDMFFFCHLFGTTDCISAKKTINRIPARISILYAHIIFYTLGCTPVIDG